MPRKTPTQNIEALSRFSEGRALFDLYLETGNPAFLSGAQECFDRAVAEDSRFDTAKFYQAVSRIELGDRTEAIKHLEALTNEEALERSPELERDGHVQLAQAYAEEGKYEKAESELTKARKGASRDERCLIVHIPLPSWQCRVRAMHEN
jgi:tetratricopeptide (TPR) repeat protein